MMVLKKITNFALHKGRVENIALTLCWNGVTLLFMTMLMKLIFSDDDDNSEIKWKS
jgi:hypothetical protein